MLINSYFLCLTRITTFLSSKAPKIKNGHSDKVSYRADVEWSQKREKDLITDRKSRNLYMSFVP